MSKRTSQFHLVLYRGRGFKQTSSVFTLSDSRSKIYILNIMHESVTTVNISRSIPWCHTDADFALCRPVFVLSMTHGLFNAQGMPRLHE